MHTQEVYMKYKPDMDLLQKISIVKSQMSFGIQRSIKSYIASFLQILHIQTYLFHTYVIHYVFNSQILEFFP